MSTIRGPFISKMQRFIVGALIFQLFGSYSIAQTTDNIQAFTHISHSICEADVIVQNEDIDCIAVEGGFVIAPKKYSLQSKTDFESAHSRFKDIVADFNGPIALIVGFNKANDLKALFDKNDILTIGMPTNIERQEMIGTGIRKAIKQVNPTLPPEEVEKFVKQALERSIGETATSSLSESGLMQHELCHTWLNAYVQSLTQDDKALPQTYAAYGTGLPDWLDEAVAVSCESERDRERRMTDLGRIRNAGMLVPLARFLEAHHPRNGRKVTSEGQASSTSQSDVTVSVKINAPGSISPTLAFYSQAYGVLNFLSEFSGRPDISQRIIDAFVKGGDARAVVLSSVRRKQKRLSLNELEQLWAQWLITDVR